MNQIPMHCATSWTHRSRTAMLLASAVILFGFCFSAEAQTNGLKGEYFPNTTLSGLPTQTRIDPTINFTWGPTKSPIAGFSDSNYSVRWSGQVLAAYSETYTFYTTTDDGARLWVNGKRVVDRWMDQGAAEWSGTVDLVAGQKYDIEFEYYQGGGGAAAQLRWSSASTSKALIPAASLFPTNSGTTSSGPLTISNFSFETPVVGATSATYQPSGASWTMSATNGSNGSGISGANSPAFTQGGGAILDGVQTAFLRGTGSFSQPVSGFSPGTSYTLTFSAAQRAGNTNAHTWQAILDGVVLATYTPSKSATNYTDYAATFTTSGGTFILTLLGTNANGGDNATLIDNIRIAPEAPPAAPSAPTGLAASALSPTEISLTWTDASANETGFVIERKLGSAGTYTVAVSVVSGSTSYTDSGLVGGTLYYYRVNAVNTGGASAYSNVTSARTNNAKLTGTIIGTSGSYDNKGDIKDKAMDGDLATFFDGPGQNGMWVGLDLGAGASKVVSSVRYAPRVTWAHRMVQGKFQGSNTADFSSGVVDLFTVTAIPVEGIYTTQAISSGTGFRYVRYLSPTGGCGNASEIEFYGRDAVPLVAPAAPTGLTATTLSSSQITLAWVDHATNETGFTIERKIGSGGAYIQVATPSPDADAYQDNSLAPSTTYYYRIAATNFELSSAYSNEAAATTPAEPVVEGLPNLKPLAFTNVQLTANSFWGHRITTNLKVSLPKMYQSFIDNHNLENFPKVSGNYGIYQGYPWADSDVYKTLEGMALAIKLDTAGDGSIQQAKNDLLTKLNQVVPTIALAQRQDGYIDTYIQAALQGHVPDLNPAPQPFEAAIWTHEDYCMGHMMEAAIAHNTLTGNSQFLDVARKAANYLSNRFGDAPKESMVPGHQEVEIALMRLYDLQHHPSDLELARFYIEERGRPTHGRARFGEFCQDIHQPRHEISADGHCVRGGYMWNGATRVAAARGDMQLLNSMETIWSNIVNTKMYATGGVGHGLYNEGFGPDYDLSNYYAYAETCGSCAMITWSQQLGNLRGDGKYMDIVERELYNGFASGRALDGSELYYNNYLTRTGYKGRTGIVCCATNTVRVIPSIPGYQYATAANDGIWTHLYMAGQASLTYGSGQIGIQQTTNYPWEGNIAMTFTVQTPTAFKLHLRIPAWATGATATVNSSPMDISNVVKGYATINRTWSNGDIVQLVLPMTPRRIRMDERVVADYHRVAIARGPIVFCLESYDNPSADVHRIVIPPTALLTASNYDSSVNGGIVRITGTGRTVAANGSTNPFNFTMIPYALWDNRSNASWSSGRNYSSDMDVMIPEYDDGLTPQLDLGNAAGAIVTTSFSNGNWHDLPSALNDGIWPLKTNGDKAESDNVINRTTWWPNLGSEEWAQYEFPEERTISRADLFWYDDGGGVGVPASATIMYAVGDTFYPVISDLDYTSLADLYAKGHFCIYRFAPVKTKKIRLVMTGQPNKSVGLLEWRLPAYSPPVIPPATGFRANLQKNVDGTMLVTSTVTPGFRYQVQTAPNLTGWSGISGTEKTAGAGVTQLQWTVSPSGTDPQFWRVVVIDP